MPALRGLKAPSRTNWERSKKLFSFLRMASMESFAVTREQKSKVKYPAPQGGKSHPCAHTTAGSLHTQP
jgi:hypothetical protein